MANESASIVSKLWNFCTVLRDDGVSYGDYVEQLTYLLFLKMADEQTKPPFNKPSIIPDGLDWASLRSKDGDELEVQYRHTLDSLGKGKGMLGVIFRKAQNKIQDPAKLKRLINLIDEETWAGIDIDVKGDIYELRNEWRLRLETVTLVAKWRCRAGKERQWPVVTLSQ